MGEGESNFVLRFSSKPCATAILAVLLLSATLSLSPASAKTIYVNSSALPSGSGTSWTDAYISLQDALDSADPCDQIWVSAGTYTPDPFGLADPREASFQMKNSVAIYGGFPSSGDPCMIDRDPNTYLSILSGDLLGNDDPCTPVEDLLDDPCRNDNAYHVFYHPDGLNLNSSALLDGFTITAGYADVNGNYDYGAGMYNLNSNPAITNCTFTANVSDYGAGISNLGWYLYGHHSSNPKITSCTFNGNSAQVYGGGIYNDRSSPIVSACTFSNNLACLGGAMYNTESRPTVISCAFTANASSNFIGGGIFNEYYSRLTLINCTFTAHTLDSGCFNVLCDNNGSSSMVINSIFWDNDVADLFSWPSSITCFCCDIEGCYAGGSWNWKLGIDGGGNIDADPCFIDADGPDDIPGTADDNLRLKSVSPCIDSGHNPSVITPLDLDGSPRIMDGDDNGTATVDMGACEYNGPAYDPVVIYVNAAAAGADDGSSWPDAFNILQDALDTAVIGDQIWVAQGTYRPTYDYEMGVGTRGKHFQLQNYLALYGGFPATGDPDFSNRDPDTYPTFLSGDRLGNDDPCTPVEGLLDDPSRSDNVYHVIYHPPGTNLDNSALLDGFTITAGNADPFDSFPLGCGGGMYNYYSSPTVTNCIFTTNSSQWYGTMANYWNSSPNVTNCLFSKNYRSGIGNNQSNPAITNCNFISNYSYHGGGIYNYDRCDPIINNCNFITNSTVSRGGGMYNEAGNYYPGYSCNPIVTGCTFIANSAGEDGGGLYNDFSNPILYNCTFTANKAADSGGGLYNDYSSPTVANCILYNNSAANGNEIHNYNHSTPNFSYCDIANNGGSGAGWDSTLGNDGGGNIDVDPCFVDPGLWDDPCNTPSDPTDDVWIEGDYHLKSSGWRWDEIRQRWDYDNVTSRCIDAGNPGSPLADELLTIPDDPTNLYGENIRINMGAYGGTSQASMPPYDWSLLADLTNDGTVNLSDFAGQTTYWLQSDDQQPPDLNRDGSVNITDLSLLLSDWLSTTSWFH